MAESDGAHAEVAREDDNEALHKRKGFHRSEKRRETLYEVLHRLISVILFPQPGNSDNFLQRIKISFSENAPLIPAASRNTTHDVLLWTRRGSPFRALLVISVGTINLIALTGLLVFMFFFLAATLSAIVISLLVSLAAAGGFLALFFTVVTAIYIGALLIAMFAISVTTFWAIVAIVITTGWIGFFWTLWFVTKKSFRFAKHSLSVTGSAISTYTAAQHVRHLQHRN